MPTLPPAIWSTCGGSHRGRLRWSWLEHSLDTGERSHRLALSLPHSSSKVILSSLSKGYFKTIRKSYIPRPYFKASNWHIPRLYSKVSQIPRLYSKAGQIPRPVRFQGCIPRPVRFQGCIPRPVRFQGCIPRPVRFQGCIPRLYSKAVFQGQSDSKVSQIPRLYSKVGQIPRLYSKVGQIPRLYSKAGQIPRLYSKVGQSQRLYSKAGQIPRLYSKAIFQSHTLRSFHSRIPIPFQGHYSIKTIFQSHSKVVPGPFQKCYPHSKIILMPF